jgi:hypothetical protein
VGAHGRPVLEQDQPKPVVLIGLTAAALFRLAGADGRLDSLSWQTAGLSTVRLGGVPDRLLTNSLQLLVLFRRKN